MNILDLVLREASYSYSLPIRKLGKTNLSVTGFALGGQALIEQEKEEKKAVKLINKAIDLGINYYDTATVYGPSRKYLGKALGENRDKVIIASKLRERGYKEAKKELDEAFKLLKTDYIDIMQLHSLRGEEDKRALTRDGAVRVLEEARKAGKIGYIGITGHHNPAVLNDFIATGKFDTILLPVNPVCCEFFGTIRKARSNGMGVIGMKIMSRGVLSSRFPADKLLQYSMSKSDVCIVGCSNEVDLKENVDAAKLYDGREIRFKVSEELERKAGYHLERFEGDKWPDTYQPNLKKLKYED